MTLITPYDAVVRICSSIVERYEAYLRKGHTSSACFNLLYRGDAETGVKAIPGYSPNDVVNCRAYARALSDLESEGLLRVRWRKAAACDVVKDVHVDLGRIALAYEHAGAVFLSKRAAALAATVDANLESASVPWIRSWAVGFQRSAESDPMSVCSRWDGREDSLRDLVSMMLEYDALGTGAFVSQRKFSVVCFGDSKKLERSVGKNFIQAAASCGVSVPEGSITSQLESFGLYRYPPFLSVGGPCSVELKGNRIDCLIGREQGSCIPAALFAENTVDDVSVLIPKTSRVVVVENKATYYEFLAKHWQETVVIFGHGQPTFYLLSFLRLLSLSLSKRIEVWSDVDLGGFLIAERIMRKVPGSVPYRMDVKTLESVPCTALLAHNSEYIDKIKRYAENPDATFKKEAEWIVAHGATLEQEALPV